MGSGSVSPSQQNIIPRVEVTSTSPPGVLGGQLAVQHALGLPEGSYSSWMRWGGEAPADEDEGGGEEEWEGEAGAEEAGAAGGAAGGDAAATSYEPAGNRQRPPPFRAADEEQLLSFLQVRAPRAAIPAKAALPRQSSPPWPHARTPPPSSPRRRGASCFRTHAAQPSCSVPPPCWKTSTPPASPEALGTLQVSGAQPVGFLGLSMHGGVGGACGANVSCCVHVPVALLLPACVSAVGAALRPPAFTHCIVLIRHLRLPPPAI